ncbi:MAG: hypothetical protein ACXWF8_09715, partial [Methylobacter sp.]
QSFQAYPDDGSSPGKIAVCFPKTPDYNPLNGADSTKYSDSNGADNGNKPTLPSGQCDQTRLCFL